MQKAVHIHETKVLCSTMNAFCKGLLRIEGWKMIIFVDTKGVFKKESCSWIQKWSFW